MVCVSAPLHLLPSTAVAAPADRLSLDTPRHPANDSLGFKRMGHFAHGTLGCSREVLLKRHHHRRSSHFRGQYFYRRPTGSSLHSVPFTMREGVIRLVVRFGNTFSRPAA